MLKKKKSILFFRPGKFFPDALRHIKLADLVAFRRSKSEVRRIQFDGRQLLADRVQADIGRREVDGAWHALIHSGRPLYVRSDNKARSSGSTAEAAGRELVGLCGGALGRTPCTLFPRAGLEEGANHSPECTSS